MANVRAEDAARKHMITKSNLREAGKRYGGCAKKVKAKCINPNAPTSGESELLIAFGIASDWSRRAAALQPLQYSGRLMNKSRKTPAVTELIRFTMAWSGMNALFARPSVLALLGGKAAGSELQLFKVLLTNSNLSTQLVSSHEDVLQRILATTSLISGMGHERLLWLNGIPIEALVELRRNNENATFRDRLLGTVRAMHDSAIQDTDRVAAEMSAEIAALVGEHEREVRSIQDRYLRSYGQTAIAAWAAFGATLMPSLAPFIGAAAPFAIATKYAWDKIDELSERRVQSRSLMGVLAQANAQKDE